MEPTSFAVLNISIRSVEALSRTGSQSMNKPCQTFEFVFYTEEILAMRFYGKRDNFRMETGLAIILMGIPASGKSTFAKSSCAFAVRINLDTLHTRAREKKLLAACIASHRSFVIDNTNPRRVDRAGYIRQAKEAGYRVIGYLL